MNRIEIKEFLLSQEDLGYRAFHGRLIPGAENIIGVRTPILKKKAAEMVRDGYEEFFEELREVKNEEVFYEERILQGFIIGKMKADCETRMEYVRQFVPHIDNWAVCDLFCGGLKSVKQETEEYWEFIKPYFKDEREFHVRFGVVLAMSYFVDEEHIHQLLEIAENINHDGYYAKMAVAWALSLYYVKFPKETKAFFQKSDNKIDTFTFNKAIQKIRESYRVPKEDKEYLKTLKR